METRLARTNSTERNSTAPNGISGCICSSSGNKTFTDEGRSSRRKRQSSPDPYRKGRPVSIRRIFRPAAISWTVPEKSSMKPIRAPKRRRCSGRSPNSREPKFMHKYGYYEIRCKLPDPARMVVGLLAPVSDHRGDSESGGVRRGSRHHGKFRAERNRFPQQPLGRIRRRSSSTSAPENGSSRRLPTDSMSSDSTGARTAMSTTLTARSRGASAAPSRITSSSS